MAFAAPHERCCSLCGEIFRSDAPGARWTNPKGNPRYVHPNCPRGAKPSKAWKPAPNGAGNG